MAVGQLGGGNRCPWSCLPLFAQQEAIGTLDIVTFSPQGDSAFQGHRILPELGTTYALKTCNICAKLQMWYVGSLWEVRQPGKVGREAVTAPVVQLSQQEMRGRRSLTEGRASQECGH